MLKRLQLPQLILSLLGAVIAVVTVIYMANNAPLIGSWSLPLRALLLSVAVSAAMLALYPLNPLFAGKPGSYLLVVMAPALIPGLVYYGVLLPQRAGEGLVAEQLQSQLISDRSSNGFVEVGFSYPIFTPTVTITNRELFTREVNVFLRIVDANNETALFRAVRSRIPGSSLSVESTVQGMLGENDGFLFLPIQVAPMQRVEGKVVFIISNLDDGATFTEAMGRAYQANFELRDPESGALLLEFPLNHL